MISDRPCTHPVGAVAPGPPAYCTICRTEFATLQEIEHSSRKALIVATVADRRSIPALAAAVLRERFIR